ncbi:MAG TPA: hypothetical protein VMF89_00020, partial [Polyangiales bacterium]|nr:hypothetical protein [Polyangiales bacterium]
RIQAEPIGSPLKVNPALADRAKPAYRDGLRALVRKHARGERLTRLALNHAFESAYGRWLMRAVVRARDGTFQLLVIPGSNAVTQQIHNRFNQGFEVDPPNDSPPGLDGVLHVFLGAGTEQQQQQLAFLRAIDDPGKTGSDDLPCVACHVATELLERRAATLITDAGGIPGAYDGGAYNLSLETSRRKETLGTVLALGYWLDLPVLSRRVVNETAQVLNEIEARFP